MIVSVLLPLVIAFIMFSLGLGMGVADFGRVIRFPRAFAVGLLNQLILLPLVAFGLAHGFGLSPVFAVGLMILALCPGGVTSNLLTKLAGGNAALSISLTATASLLSILTVPFLVSFAVRHFMDEEALQVNVTGLSLKMFLLTALPVILGMTCGARFPGFSKRIGTGVSRAATGLFVLIIMAALASNWEVFSSNLGRLAPVAVVLNLAMLALGLASCQALSLKGKEATAISIESGVQNGTVAIAVGSFVAASDGQILPPETVPAAVYSITMYLVCLPFVFWRRRIHKGGKAVL